MSLTADSGAAVAGLRTTVLPAMQRGARRPGGQRHREVERADDREDAVRPQDRAGVDRAVAEVAHRVVVAAVVLHRLGVVADEVRRFLDLAERLDAVLADLESHHRGLVHEPVADQLGGASQDREALRPRRRGPGRLRADGRPRPRRRCRPACRSRRCRRGCRVRSASAPRTSPSPSRHAPST